MNGKPPIPITFSGGMNNVDTPLDLFLRKRGEVPLLVNADTTLKGRLKLLRPLTALNTTAANSAIHTIYRGKGKKCILVGYGTALDYLYPGQAALTSLFTGLNNTPKSIGHAGDWVYLGDGKNNRSIWLPGPTACSWGQAIPAAAPTVVEGAAGNPSGTYSCYYRYKITLPDGAILRTGLSPVGTVTLTDKKIEWSTIVHSTYTGAGTLQVELFRNADSGSTYYLVTTLTTGTTVYTDNLTDAALILKTEFAETDYYPPPDNVDLVIYHPGADRIFCTVGNDIYWSLAGTYNVFQYSSSASEYTNVNSVFLSGENITALVMIDEQFYIGCERTWRRLRGTNPTYWRWEDTAARKGPVSWQAVAETPWGVIYPGNDGYLYIFNGFEAIRLLEHFQFDTKPDSNSRAIWDGRFYRLFYGDTTYPELILDFFGYPAIPPRIIQSTRDASACHYDPSSNTLYLGDPDGYIRSGEDTTQSVTLTMRTHEIPMEQLVYLSDQASLLIHANTKGDNLVITPYQDEVAQTALTAFTSTALIRKALSLPLNIYRSLSLGITITSSGDVELREPWLLSQEDDG